MWMKPPPRPRVTPDLTNITECLGELGNKTKLALYEAWLDGETIQRPANGGWADVECPNWVSKWAIYRVKPKQNKELEEAQKKVEEATKALEKATELLNMIKREV